MGTSRIQPLSYEAILHVTGFPDQWLPTVFAFDPDLPLFPLLYFHESLAQEGQGSIGIRDRAYGYIRALSVGANPLQVSAKVVCNVDLMDPRNHAARAIVQTAIENRLGVASPVTSNDISGAFSQTAYSHHEAVLKAIWNRSILNHYGDRLPFGAVWDPSFGLIRAFASWNPPGGRKSELIQLHYFAKQFGERVGGGSTAPVDYFLLPTIGEIRDTNNSLSDFPQFQLLCEASNALCNLQPYFSDVVIGNTAITGVTPHSLIGLGKRLTAEVYEKLIGFLSPNYRIPLTQCFNAFDKGAHRTLMFLMFLADIRRGKTSGGKGLLDLSRLTPSDAAELAISASSGCYVSPKVLSFYANQALSNPNALPIDTWIQTFLEYPLAIAQAGWNSVSRTSIANYMRSTQGLGRIERIIWLCSQARKVHSSVCDDALWCIKYGSSESESDTSLQSYSSAFGEPRGANPLACRACLRSIRRECPAYSAISSKPVSINAQLPANGFLISLDSQGIAASCVGQSVFRVVLDLETPRDDPTFFQPLTQNRIQQIHTVDDFVN